MHYPLNIIIVGRDSSHVGPVAEALQAEHGLELSTHIAGNGRQLELDKSAPPDALVLAVGQDWHGELEALVDALPTVHPPFVVVGPDTDVNFLKAAMRAGARDLITLPFDNAEFLSALSHVAEQERLRAGGQSSRIIAVINSKGGSGATFVATNVATALARTLQGMTIVVDLDFQFGSLPTYLDLPSTNGLIKALEFADSLDEAALQGYVQTHKSGLHMLAAAMNDIILPEDVSEERVRQLLNVLDGLYRFIILDVPRRIDSTTTLALLEADEILVVTEQSMSHLHDTKRMMYLLQSQLGIGADRIRLIVNRYDKKADVRLEDFSSVLVGVTVETLPTDYRRVASSINLGVPLCVESARSLIGRRLCALATSIASSRRVPDTGGGGLFGWLSRSA